MGLTEAAIAKMYKVKKPSRAGFRRKDILLAVKELTPCAKAAFDEAAEIVAFELQITTKDAAELIVTVLCTDDWYCKNSKRSPMTNIPATQKIADIDSERR